MTQKNIFSNYNLDGNFLDDYQAACFKAPIALAAKIVFMQNLPVNNYYDSAIITLVTMEFF